MAISEKISKKNINNRIENTGMNIINHVIDNEVVPNP